MVATPGGPASAPVLAEFAAAGVAAQEAVDAVLARHAEPAAGSAERYEQHSALVNFAARVKLAMDRRTARQPDEVLAEVAAAVAQLDQRLGWGR